MAPHDKTIMKVDELSNIKGSKVISADAVKEISPPDTSVMLRKGMGREPCVLDRCPHCGMEGTFTTVTHYHDEGSIGYMLCSCVLCPMLSCLPFCVKSVSENRANEDYISDYDALS